MTTFIQPVTDDCPEDTKREDSSVYEQRREENRILIENWHDQINKINDRMRELQPDISKALKVVIGFSDVITEKYVLQFAKMQIELYNIINDNLIYHKSKCLGVDNKDYINAVENYSDLLYFISDSLAVFGIEEIVSSEGDSFNGKIHECEETGFLSKTAMVKKSIRSGFKYNDLIIQKEKVELR